MGLLNLIQGRGEWPILAWRRFCDLPSDEIGTFYDWFVTAPRAITLYTMGINQSSSGSDKATPSLTCILPAESSTALAAARFR